MTDRAAKIVQEFDKLMAEEGLTPPVTQEQGTKLIMSAAYSVGFDDGYNAGVKAFLKEIQDNHAG